MATNIVKFKSLVKKFPERELFFEDFQDPAVVDVSGYDEGVVPSRWLRANNGFGNQRIGLNDGDITTDWVTATGKTQGLDPNYTNSGACTKIGEIGTINVNTVKYRITAEIAYDKSIISKNGSASGAYEVMLCALEGGFDRQDWAAGAGDFDARVLTKLQGSVADDGQIHEVIGEYTTDPTTDAGKVGYDLAVGIDGASEHAIVVSVKVELMSA